VSKIEIFFEEIQPNKIRKRHIKNAIKYLINNEIKELGDLSIILCSDNYLLKINKEYLNHDYYTDIITFNYVEGNRISGDLFISSDRIKENSVEYNTTLIKELYRVMFHGVLHLIGYNDKTVDEKKVMREKEDFYLSEVDFRGIEI
jgi:probable rRNA maturation factor